MTRTAINLYSVRELEEPMVRTLERVADAGYDGVQFSGGFRDATVAEIREALDELDLDVTAAHVGIDDQEADLESTVETYESIGCDGLVVPWLPPEEFETRADVEDVADRLEGLFERVQAIGMDLHYHNHDQEFTDVGGETAFDVLLERTSLEIELDVGWAATGGQDPVSLLSELGDRAPLVHMKDMDVENRAFVEIGEGDVDMQACADAAREAGADWLVYEHDDPADPIASIEYGAEFLASL